jgi:hypothetical protein
MADHEPNQSPTSDPIDPEASSKEDADTAAATEELKQTVISDKISIPTDSDLVNTQTSAAIQDKTGRDTTPERDLPDAQDEDLKEQISSPKKKRAHDQVEEDSQALDNDAKSVESNDSAKDRAIRSEPEKKRPRDKVAESQDGDAPKVNVHNPIRFSKHLGLTRGVCQESLSNPSNTSLAVNQPATATTTFGSPKKSQPATSASAFATSGFSALSTSSSSPFGSLSGPKGSVFGGSTTSGSSFSSIATSKPAAPAAAAAIAAAAAPTLSFGGSTGSSPFATLNSTGTNGFGSAFGSGFGSAFPGRPLTSFAKPGEGLKSDKPAKPFGAPESDAEEESAEESGDEESEADDVQKEDSDKEDSKAASDEKKKLRLQRGTLVLDANTGCPANTLDSRRQRR